MSKSNGINNCCNNDNNNINNSCINGIANGLATKKSVDTTIRLRAATYLAPTIPVGYFEIILEYLKLKIGYIDTSLRYESNVDNLNKIFANNEIDMVQGLYLTIILEYLKLKIGYIDTSLRYESNVDNLNKIFANNEIDMAWISDANHLNLLRTGQVALLPVATVHSHPKLQRSPDDGNGNDDGNINTPGYYYDVVIHKSLRPRVSCFGDLRGCRWTYNVNQPTAAHLLTVNELKKLGVNGHFFGHQQQSGSDLQSIHMILNGQSDATAVDSNCLQIFLDRNPQLKPELLVLVSVGPLAPYPIVVNNLMPQKLRDEICDALIGMHRDPYFGKRLAKYMVKRFVRISKQDIIGDDNSITTTNTSNNNVSDYNEQSSKANGAEFYNVRYY
ncbi:uncharacterized protein LOC128953491 [Oppia nitens]|uniref:uncharacterized protein LOC128953491 n=1 Tax=Oppia nitens TaxID=1686743 RepID=UPI0023DBE9A0|nr:uncharacterized protein LOC128953491 [Oppia nitens]